MKNIGYSTTVETTFDAAVENLDSALKDQGFGILTKIDMQAKLKEKIDKDIEKYMIFGACNPGLAYEALLGEYEIGLLLPCNVIVYEKDGKVVVSAIIPSAAMDMVDSEIVKKVADEAEEKLKKVIDSL